MVPEGSSVETVAVALLLFFRLDHRKLAMLRGQMEDATTFFALLL